MSKELNGEYCLEFCISANELIDFLNKKKIKTENIVNISFLSNGRTKLIYFKEY